MPQSDSVSQYPMSNMIAGLGLTGCSLQAVAGADHSISLISIVEARVVSLFKGAPHSSAVFAFACKPAHPAEV